MKEFKDIYKHLDLAITMINYLNTSAESPAIKRFNLIEYLNKFTIMLDLIKICPDYYFDYKKLSNHLEMYENNWYIPSYVKRNIDSIVSKHKYLIEYLMYAKYIRSYLDDTRVLSDSKHKCLIVYLTTSKLMIKWIINKWMLSDFLVISIEEYWKEIY